MDCRAHCGACCIAPSISTPIPDREGEPGTGLPGGKPAGVRCPQLDAALRCRLFGSPRRPAVCASLSPSPSMCGHDAAQALHHLTWLERQTAPGATPSPPAPATR
jgi:uncharacterized protein